MPAGSIAGGFGGISMTKIWLIRHGQTEWNLAGRYQGQSDIELSAKGVRQAELLAEHLAIENIDHIDAVYASDLKRAMKTAACIAKKAGCELQLEPALRELNFGVWEGKTYAAITEQWPEVMHTFFARPDLLVIPEGETFAQLQQRAAKKLEQIARRHAGGSVVIVAHGAIIRTLLAYVLHLPLRYLWSFRQDNTAVNMLHYTDENGWLVELMNSTAHLRG